MCEEQRSVLGKIADAVDETDGMVGFQFLHSDTFESGIDLHKGEDHAR